MARLAEAQAHYAALLAEGLAPRAAWAAVVAEHHLDARARKALLARLARAGLPGPGAGRPESTRTRRAAEITAKLLDDVPSGTAGALALAATGATRDSLRRALTRRGIAAPVRLDDRRITRQLRAYAAVILGRCEKIAAGVGEPADVSGWTRMAAVADAAVAAARALANRYAEARWKAHLDAAGAAARDAIARLGGPAAAMRDLFAAEDPVIAEVAQHLTPTGRREAAMAGLPVPYKPSRREDGIGRPISRRATMSPARLEQLRLENTERLRAARLNLAPAERRRRELERLADQQLAAAQSARLWARRPRGR